MAEFAPMDLDRRQRVSWQNIIRACWRPGEKTATCKCRRLPCGLDSEGRAVISSRETAYKVNNLRRDPRAALCVFTRSFTAKAGCRLTAQPKIISLPARLDTLMYLQRQAYGEHKSWPEFHERMAREKRVIIRITIESVGPKVRG